MSDQKTGDGLTSDVIDVASQAIFLSYQYGCIDAQWESGNAEYGDMIKAKVAAEESELALRLAIAARTRAVPVIDEEMVERALAAYWDDERTSVYFERNFMRKALEAALGPGAQG
jgi:hypothetical protein